MPNGNTQSGAPLVRLHCNLQRARAARLADFVTPPCAASLHSGMPCTAISSAREALQRQLFNRRSSCSLATTMASHICHLMNINKSAICQWIIELRVSENTFLLIYPCPHGSVFYEPVLAMWFKCVCTAISSAGEQVCCDQWPYVSRLCCVVQRCSFLHCNL